MNPSFFSFFESKENRVTLFLCLKLHFKSIFDFKKHQINIYLFILSTIFYFK